MMEDHTKGGYHLFVLLSIVSCTPTRIAITALGANVNNSEFGTRKSLCAVSKVKSTLPSTTLAYHTLGSKRGRR
jgi:hypothetical protein